MNYNILSVDELGITKFELSSMLKNISISITGVKDEIEALNALHNNGSSIKAILWTVNSSEFRDFDAIKRIKSKENYKNIPVVIVSRFADKKYILKAIECGAVEYIAKPYDEAIVTKKICKVLGISSESPSGKAAEEDIITFSFADMLSREIKGASRGQYPLSILLAAVVPEANDSDAQNNVEEIINLINKIISTKLRETDTAFRYGTENLMILLPFSNSYGAKTVEKKLENIFNSHSIIKQKKKGCSLIIGSVTFPEDGKIKEKLLDKLDKNISEVIKNNEKK